MSDTAELPGWHVIPERLPGVQIYEGEGIVLPDRGPSRKHQVDIPGTSRMRMARSITITMEVPASDVDKARRIADESFAGIVRILDREWYVHHVSVSDSPSPIETVKP